MATRIYIGNISTRTYRADLESAFSKYGTVSRLDLKEGFGFIEFNDADDADDAIRGMDGYEIDGRQLVVEVARGGRSLTDSWSGGGGGGGGGRGGARGGFRLDVKGLDMRTSWQDLKDFARKAGDVTYTDVWTERGKKYGCIEYSTEEDMNNCLIQLDDTKLDNRYVRIYLPGKGGKTPSPSRSRSRSRSRRRRRDRSSDRRRSYSRRNRSRSRSRSRSRRKDSRSRSRGRDRDYRR